MKEKFLKNESLAKYTTFQIGGPAELFFVAKSKDELIEALGYGEENSLPVTIIGGGSNVLISDVGIKGLVVLNQARVYEFDSDNLYCESGANLMKVAGDAVKLELDFSFAAGIPGTIGGAVVGNAGAHGKEIADILVEAEVWDGKVKKYQRSDFDYRYRSSKLKGTKKIVLSATLKLGKGNKVEMENSIASDRSRRANLYRGLTCGSYFKNPEEDSAGALIDRAGLKGFRSGNAQVNPNHANVILNLGGAKAADIIELENHIVKTVKDKFGVTLEPEVVKVGF